MCVCEEVDCNPELCPRAKGHFDRVNDAVFEMLTEQERFGRDDILAQSEKWQVCPYEMQLDLAVFMDAVICDYNYVFDPVAVSYTHLDVYKRQKMDRRSALAPDSSQGFTVPALPGRRPTTGGCASARRC